MLVMNHKCGVAKGMMLEIWSCAAAVKQTKMTA